MASATPPVAISASPLAWLKGEIEHSIMIARENLALAAGPMGIVALEASEKHMRQVRGALQMLGMEGATRYTELIEYAIILFGTGKIRMTQESVSILDRAMFALKQFLDDIVKGEFNVPLKLFPVYRDLSELQGNDAVSEIDLFFPELSALPPENPATRDIAPADVARYVQQQRALFQRGLLAWLRQAGNRQGLQHMRIAVDALDQVRTQTTGTPALWWIAGAFIDALTLQDTAEWTVNVKAVCGRIDRHMRDLASGTGPDDQALARELLYVVATCKPLSRRIRDVKQVFHLDAQIPDYGLTGTLEYDLAKLQPVLDDMRTRLEAIEDAWARYTGGERGAVLQVRDQANRLKAMAKDLGGYRIVKLLDVIILITSRLPELFPEQNETLVMEMAAAFLLIEGVLDNFTNPPGDLEQQVTVMVGWLLDAVKPSGAAPAVAPALRDDVTQRHQLQQIRSQVAREMIANLQQVEQVLDAIARDPSAKDGTASVLESLQQIRGALAMLGLDRATEVLVACEEMVAPLARMAAGDIVPRIEWVAEGLSSLGFYLEPIQRGQLPGDALLDHFLTRLRRLASTPVQGATVPAADAAIGSGRSEGDGDAAPRAAAMERPAAPPQAATTPVPPATAQDVRDAAELLVVYIEESREVLGSTVEHLERVLRDFRDTGALIEIRRGFHTLKGSGRMVGLTDLGEFAWEIEQVLNFWLRDDRPATPDLLDLIDRARNAFSGWISALEQRQPLDFSPRDEIVSLAMRLRVAREDTPDAVRPPVSVASEAAEPARSEVRTAPAAPPPVDEIVIGGARLSPALLEIFRSEASTHLGTLEREFVAWQAQPGILVSHEFMRAAHTLASSSRTTGFGAIAELAGTLEQWLQHLMVTPANASGDAIAVVHDSIATLSGMFAEVEARRQPLASRSLVGRIRRLIDAVDGTISTHPPPLSVTGEPMTDDAPSRAPSAPVDVPSALMAIPSAPVPAASITGETSDTVPPGSAELPMADIHPSAIVGPAFAGTVAPASPSEAVSPPLASRDTPASPAQQVMQTAIRDDLDAQLLPVFVEEALGLVQQLASDIRALRAHPTDMHAARSLTRALHTLKGSARMAGAMRIGELTHAMESRVAASIETTADRSGTESGFGRMLEETETDLDRLADLIEALTTGTPPPAPSPVPPAAQTELPSAPAHPESMHSSRALPDTGATPSPPPVWRPAASIPPQPPPVRTEPQPPPFADAFAATAATTTLRVDADIIDHLVNEIGEVTIARSRIEGEMATFKQSLLDLTDSLARLRTQLRETQIQADSQMQSRLSQVKAEQGQFDPLELDRYTRLQELTRLMTESLHDVSLVQQALLGNVAETEGAIIQQARVSRDLQQELLRMRSVPLSVINERLYRTVRQTARQLRKRATLEVRGADIELDRSVLRRIAGPLEHMLRNAIAHGIESTDVRLASGKNEAGRIEITFAQDGSENVITVRDDGAGLDLARVRDEGIRKGLLKSGEDVSEAGLRQLVFAPGFSTAMELTQTSGRGIGLDVVRSEVSGIGGRVEVESESGRGTTFSIYLPLSLAQSQVVLVRAGDRTHAMLSSMVEQVREVPPEELSRLYAEGSMPWEGERRPFFYLPQLLGRREAVADIQRHNSVLVLRSGANRVIVHVDKLMRNQEVVLKHVGPQVARIPGISGATVLGNGEVVLILNPVQLALQADLAALHAGVRTRVVSEQPLAPTVMVVDDSLTVRRLTGRLLTRAGYQLATAKDGLDALQQLQDGLPDLMLLDLEMPRMDGFELLGRLRGDARTADLPIIVITSRTADKHRDHAIGLGANAFIGKPYQEDELLAHCARLLQARNRSVA